MCENETVILHMLQVNDARFSLTLSIGLTVSWMDNRIEEKVDNVTNTEKMVQILMNDRMMSNLWEPHLGIVSLKSMNVEKGVLKENRGEMNVATG